jgi:PPM family protein phosphatase
MLRATRRSATLGRFRSAARTDVGMRREHNEDWFLVNESLGLYVVCDGMGGHAGGETASRVACEAIEREMKDSHGVVGDDSADRERLAGMLRQAVQGACAAVYQTSLTDPELQGMGTTLVALLVDGDGGVVAHVGDSRVYHVRKGDVTQLTEDHSLVNEQVRAGLMSPEEARYSRLKNIITRSVGFEEEVAVDLAPVQTEPGDVFVLCSDGLSNLVDGDEIGGVVLHSESPEATCAELVDLANDRGGDDNITVVVVERVE